MSRRRGAFLRSLCAVFVLLSASLIRGQTSALLSVHYGRESWKELSVRLETHGVPTRPGGWTWVEVRAHNPDTRPHTLEVRMRSPRWGSPTVQARLELRLEPKATVSRILPIVGTRTEVRIDCVVDGYDPGSAAYTFSEASESWGLRGLAISDSLFVDNAWTVAFQGALEHIDAGHTWSFEGGRRSQVQREALRSLERALPASVPIEWRLLSGFEFVAVDCGTRLEAPLQQTLVDYVRAGGNLILIGASALDSDSMLGQIVRDEADDESGDGVVTDGRTGFGSWLAIRARVSADEFASIATTEQLRHWFDPQGSRGVRTHGASGLLPRLFVASGNGIPGVGEVSRGLFLVLLLGFAVLVGPFNYFFWRRRRQLAMLLLTVPAAGFVFTAVTLAWGLLADGLGVQGVIASVTILDQRTHDAVSHSTQRLYAGLTPDALRPRRGTWVGCDQISTRGAYQQVAAQHELEFRYPAGGLEIGGQLLPARSMSDLRVGSVGVERSRLRFARRVDNGSLECLGGGGSDFEPRKGSTTAPTLVLRDVDGRYYSGGGVGPMTALAETDVAATIEALWSPYEPLVEDAADSLPPGAYLARTDSDPARDELGLEVDWHIRHHYVFGRLAEEDIRDGQ